MGPCNSRSGRVNIYSEQSTPITEISQHGPGTVAFLERYECSFTPTEILGSGAYSTVYKCVDKESREECAAKVIQLKKMAEDEVDALHIEVGILEEIKHPNVLTIHGFFEDIATTNNPSPKAYIVTEILRGGELFDRIVERTYYSEYEARKVIQILLDVMCHLHAKNIAHRDLKPENLLLKSMKDDHELKCGTPNYVAPEILENRQYGCAVDMWSVGVLTFVLLGGYPPFHDDNEAKLFERIKCAQFNFDPQYWDVVSADAKDFIRKLLNNNPGVRLTAEQAILHPWLVKGDHELITVHLEKTMRQLRNFNGKRKFKAAARMVLTTRKFSSVRCPAARPPS
ncbi:hypothetical protein AURANDRAFT_54494 [Aureococcus anophagefferens]|uniref:Protein kinase domain-containing protein n=1 Tax=Aureococcus anophagefferens TaxID=44056 RepID=F0YGN7_AURAN|nr:hypothetical protein AURANDRAFT_54494 [Aureococcus anophagefferens]EGB05703.1 hypothetical protein AURANDRAFT_54494 [Aureococcus anophagefferens]|eukprot:XP_009039542.1 hypothetical protein AURANDRAFT_54494 [Aureococcus anophagefferens]